MNSTNPVHVSLRLSAAVFLLVGILLCGATPADAQLARRTYTDTLDVRSLNLEVVVSDRDGQRLPELTVADFVLFVDDQPVSIEYFTEVRGGAYVDTVERFAEAGVVAGKPSGTSFLVFIDEFFSLDRDKRQVLEALRKRVESADVWSPLDRVAVVSWDGKGVTVLADWTSERSEVLNALDTAIQRPGHGSERQAERNEHGVAVDVSDLAGSAGSGGGESYRLGSRELAYADLLASQLEGTVGAAAAAMRGLDVIPGRKALLLLSGGWPMNVDDWVGRSPARSIQESRIPAGADLYTPLAETANLLGYTIYGVDLPGFMQAGGPNGSKAAGAGSVEFFLEDDLHRSLKFLSSETGGLPLIDEERVSALGEVGQDVEAFYWLGYTPEWSGSDQRHTLRVEVNRPDVFLRTRAGYLDAAPMTQIAMAVKSSLLFGMGRQSSELQLEVGDVEPVGDGLFYVDIEMTIPMRILTIRESESGYDAEASLFIAALDGSGGRSEIPATPLLLSSPVPFPSKGLVAHTVTLKLRENTERVSMALYDVYGGKTYTNTIVKKESPNQSAGGRTP